MKKLILTFLLCSSFVSAKNLLEQIEPQNHQSLAITELSVIHAGVNTSFLTDGSPVLGLHFPDDAFEFMVLDQVKTRSKNNFTWFGHIKNQPHSSVYFSVVGGHISGAIHTERETFEVMPLGNNKLRMARLNTQAFADCEAEVEPDLSQFERHSVGNLISGGGTVFLDVMVLYTPQARDAAGGVTSIEATAQAAVDAMNNSFLNSNVDAEARISYTGLANYNDTGDSSADLTWVSSNASVAALRTAYGADMVSLLVDSMGGCGRGYVMRSTGPGFAGAAFQVTRRSCAVGNLSFAHEFGHNMGLEHNPEDSSATPATASNPWSFGHYHNSSYRTVMSYGNQCTNGCSRRQYFSNPDVQYLGLDTGVVGTRDNARTLRQTASIVADFRAEANDTLFEDGFDG